MPRVDGVYSMSRSQMSLPVSASSATTRLYGDDRYSTLPTTSGVAWEARLRGCAPVSGPIRLLVAAVRRLRELLSGPIRRLVAAVRRLRELPRVRRCHSG